MTTSTNSEYLIKLTLLATLDGLLFGYDTGVISGTVGSLDAFFVIPKGLSETVANSFAYWIYGIMSLSTMRFVWKFIPETKVKTL